MAQVNFYLDLISPYAFLAWHQLKRSKDAKKHEFIYKPILLAALLNHHGQPGPAEIVDKRRYTFYDILRCAKGLKLEIEGPPTHPFNPLPSLRMATALPTNKEREILIEAMFNASWLEGKDISDYTQLIKIADSCGFDGGLLRRLSGKKETKEALMQTTAESIEKGVFGVPTFEIEGELFWGNDRIDFMLAAARGEGVSVDLEHLETVLSRPSSARRK